MKIDMQLVELAVTMKKANGEWTDSHVQNLYSKVNQLADRATSNPTKQLLADEINSLTGLPCVDLSFQT